MSYREVIHKIVEHLDIEWPSFPRYSLIVQQQPQYAFAIFPENGFSPMVLSDSFPSTLLQDGMEIKEARIKKLAGVEQAYFVTARSENRK